MSAQRAAQIDRWVEANQAALVEFLRQLVQIPSEVEPPHGGELACQQFVAECYREAGASVDMFQPEDVPGLKDHPAYNGIWNGQARSLHNRPVVVGKFTGLGGGKSILFSTHVDTVPAGNHADWKEAGAFSGAVKDGKLYGRGSWDTKWGIAASLFACRCVRALSIPLRGDLIIESVSDEEYGGSHGCLASRLRGYHADIAINSEPTNMIPAPVHRGGTAWKITAVGNPGRSFDGRRLANPIHKIARIVQALQAYDAYRIPSTPPRFYEDDPVLPTYIQQISAGGVSFAEATGVPSQCHLSVWIEEHPGTDFATHRDRFIGFINDTLDADPDFDGAYPIYQQLFRYIPGSGMDPGHPFFLTMRHAYESAGREFRMEGAKLACDTYVFNTHSSTPALTLGPRGGNAHAPDEFVALQDVIDLARIFAHAIVDWCG